jgi:hypothetical protein
VRGTVRAIFRVVRLTELRDPKALSETQMLAPKAQLWTWLSFTDDAAGRENARARAGGRRGRDAQRQIRHQRFLESAPVPVAEPSASRPCIPLSTGAAPAFLGWPIGLNLRDQPMATGARDIEGSLVHLALAGL